MHYSTDLGHYVIFKTVSSKFELSVRATLVYRFEQLGELHAGAQRQDHSTACLGRCRTVLTGCVERIRGDELKIPKHTEILGESDKRGHF